MSDGCTVADTHTSRNRRERRGAARACAHKLYWLGLPANVRFASVGSIGRCNTCIKSRSAQVWKPKVSGDRSLSCRVTQLNCECAPPAVPQLLPGHGIETSNISSTIAHPLHLLRLR
jgi:hypothetical protein